MDPLLIKDTYVIRPDLYWEELFDGAVLLRWAGKAHVIPARGASPMIDFLSHFSGDIIRPDEFRSFEGINDVQRTLIQSELLRRTEDVLGDSKMPEWYSRNVDALPNSRLTFMNHGYTELPPDDLSWVRPEDWHQRYQNNLVRFLVDGADLSGKRVLDVGCGRGGAASYMRRYHEPSEVVGVDFCDGNAQFCSRTHQMQNLRFQQADAQNLPFESEYFDVVTNIESSHCYAAPKIFFQEVYRVLRKGGIFCYTDCRPNLRTAEHIERYLEQLGFRIELSKDITLNVVRALELGRDDLVKVLQEAKVDGKETDDEANHWFGGVMTQYQHYTQGRLLYELWKLRKL